MNTNDLRNIREFPDLVKYLRDELNWPIDVYDFDQLTYEYDPTELGIDSNSAVNIEEIKQLRPLLDDQPWGIFFVRFAPKRLPVVALRRILSSLAIKKRASTRVSERATWKINDLLFISSFGEVAQRQITFAHFSQDENSIELPTLRVLGWDEADTFLHIDHVQKELHHKLAWPKNEKDVDSWRSNWSSAFTLGHREVITTSKELAVRLAALASQIRKRANSILTIEAENGPIRKLHHAFRESLIHDLSEDDFADMYAQTIAYGLLSARLANPKGRTADELAVQIPVTNPFLKELMETFLNVGGRKARAGGGGIDFDELGISEVVGLLNNSNMEAVVRDFGDKNPQEDPVIHFYELFLKEYDPKKRMQRGVFYTPRPVVSYIVSSVDELLRTEFGLEDGLADITTWGEMAKRHKDLKIPKGVSPDQDFIQILDPATGTGTFLVEAIDLIHKKLVAKWKAQGQNNKIDSLWNEYVPRHLLTRLHGYELLMAPYVIAHLKIGLKLFETGYLFDCNERARIYLTNALEPAHDYSGEFDFLIPALAHEAQAVNVIKLKQRFTVVIGNPPYFGESGRGGQWISQLMRGFDCFSKEKTEDYFQMNGKPLGERNTKWLNDDYVKFIRISDRYIERSGMGIVGVITNHSWIDNPTFRGMRQSLLSTFSKLWFWDLHGNHKKDEKTPDGRGDANIFEIEQGVCISLLAKLNNLTKELVFHTDLFGTKESKSEKLLNSSLLSIKYVPIYPSNPFYLFVPQDDSLFEEYNSYWKITDIMPINTIGIVTARDNLTIHDTPDQVWMTVTDFANMPTEPARSKYNLGKDARDWKVKMAQEDLKKTNLLKQYIMPILYRPFDVKYTYYTGNSRGFICMPRSEVMHNMNIDNNLALITVRKAPSGSRCNYFYVSRNMISNGVIRSDNQSIDSLFPLYLNEKNRLTNQQQIGFETTKINLNTHFLEMLEKVDAQRVKDSEAMFNKSIEAEKIIGYFYSIFYSSSYRNRYSDFLKVDFPRIPLPRRSSLFWNLSELGCALIKLHLLEFPLQDNCDTYYNGSNDPKIVRVAWSNNVVWIDAVISQRGQPCAPGRMGFHGVPEEVWNFHIGGYQVCEKWLKDRKGRTLSNEDIMHYQKIVVALSETIRIMQEIDQVIEEHGGWPGAFQKKVDD